MSLPEVIPSAMPVFVRNLARTDFSHAVIPSGSVLLFSESDGNGGSRLVKKNPDGTFEVVGGSSLATSFYKCVSMDTTNHTWTGRQATIDPVTGVWSFEATVTTGLTYDRITPEVLHVYSQDCAFEVVKYLADIPESGLIFYLPLHEDPGSTDVKRNDISSSGSVTYGAAVQGVVCAQLTGAFHVIGPSFKSKLPDRSGTEFTISMWIRSENALNIGFIDTINAEWRAFVGLRTAPTASPPLWYVCAGSHSSAGSVSARTGFHHVLLIYASRYATLYLDGTQIDHQYSYASDDGMPFNDATFYCPGFSGGQGDCVAAFRIYDRALDAGEIAALAAEFSPTPLS